MKKMNLVLLMAFVALVNPTNSISHNNEVNHNNNNNNNNHDQSDYYYYYYAKPPNSILSLPPQGSDLPPSDDGFFRCPKLLRADMIMKVIEHMKSSGAVKAVLRTSAKFGDCVASKFCSCLMLRFAPLIDGCFGVIGAVCLKKIIPNDHALNCTLDCVNSLINNYQQLLDDGAIGDICYGKCMKSA